MVVNGNKKFSPIPAISVMNLGRFQLSLNHNDPSVVLLGLNEFKKQVLADHNAVAHFGYNGRPCSINTEITDVLHPQAPQSMTGLLLEYLTKSPQIEEMFVLWTLPGREDDRALCAAHMGALACILHIARSNITLCNSVVSRILCDHLKSLHSQLASGNTELIHSTLGLILTMMRTTPQNCKDVFQKLTLSSQTLDYVIQKGKTVNWLCSTHNHNLTTDSRLLIIILVCLVLETVDENAVLELFAEKSLMRKVMHSIGRDSPETLQIVLPGVLHAIKTNLVLSIHLHDIFDGSTIRQLVQLYTRPEEVMQSYGHNYLLELVENLRILQSSSKRSSRNAHGTTTAAMSVGRCCSFLAQYLEPHSDLRQQEVLMSVLSYQPHLLPKSISNISGLKSWEPVASAEYLGVIRYLTQLLHSAAFDHRSKTQLRAAFSSTNSNASNTTGSSNSGDMEVVVVETAEEGQQQKQSRQNLVNNMLNSWIPPGLTKKDICKMLSHKELSLQRVGLQLVHALSQRLLRAIHEAGLGSGSSAMLEHCVAAAMQSFLPEFQLLVTMRSRFVKALNEKETNPTIAAAPAAVVEDVVVDDFDFNIEGGEGDTGAAVQAEVAKVVASQDTLPLGSVYESLYVLFLQVVDTYLALSPQSVAQVKFDLLRMLDEYVLWDATQSSAEAIRSVQKLNPEILLTMLKVLRQASLSGDSCRWFGSPEDSSKMLINLIVAEDWRGAMKRTALVKLMLLAKPAILHTSVEDDAVSGEVLSAEYMEVAKKARTLLKSVLIQSGLFIGHGLVDFELNTELNAWIQALSIGEDSVLAVEALLRLSYHWNTAFCMKAAELGLHELSYLDALGVSLEDQEGSSMVPFSPVLFCAMHLIAVNFQSFAAQMPKHIRSHIAETEEGIAAGAVGSKDSFFDKYAAQFRGVLEKLMCCVIVDTADQARSSANYCRILLIGLGAVVSAGEAAEVVSGPRSLVANLMSLACLPAAGVTRASRTAGKTVSELLQSIADSVPGVLQSLEKEKSTSKKAKGATPRKAVGGSKMLHVFGADPQYYAAEVAALCLRWSEIQAVLTSDDAKLEYTDQSVTDFAVKYWYSVLSTQLGSSELAFCLGAQSLERVAKSWQRDTEQASGLHAKTCAVNRALSLMRQVHVLLGSEAFELSADGCLSIHSSMDSAASGRITRKRTQSDLGDEHRAAFAVSVMPLCQEIVQTTRALMQTVAGSPMVLSLLTSGPVTEALLVNDWLGRWLCRLVQAGADAAARQRRSLGPMQEDDPAALHWTPLADVLADSCLEYTDGSAAASLRDLASVIIKVVDNRELRKLIVAVAADSDRLSQLAQLTPLTAVSADVPSLANVDSVTEDVLRTAPLAHLISSTAGLIETASFSGSSPLQCTVFHRTGTEKGFFLSPSSLLKPSTGNQEGISSLHDTVDILCVLSSLQLPSELLSKRTGVEQGTGLLKALSVSSELQQMSSGEVDVDAVVAAAVSAVTAADASILKDALALVTSIASSSAVTLACCAYVVQWYTAPVAGTGVLPIVTLFEVAHQSLAGSKERWAELLLLLPVVFIAAIDACTATLSSISTTEATHSTKEAMFTSLAGQLRCVQYFIALPAVKGVEIESVDPAGTMKKKLNKLVKSAMKNGFESAVVLRWVSSLLSTFSSTTSLLLRDKLQASSEEFYHPQTLFNLLPSHSKFSTILNGAKENHHHSVKVPLLVLLLQLTAIVCKPLPKSGKKKKTSEVADPTTHYFLADCLVSEYGGTLSEADRICFRILTRLSEAGMCPPLCTLRPRASASIVTADGLRSAEDRLGDSAKWVVEGISPPVAYATLTKFPIWRSMNSQPLIALEDTTATHANIPLSADDVERAWKTRNTAAKSSDRDDENETEGKPEDLEVVPTSDLLLNCSEKLLDPAFYLPAVFHVLRNREVSVRQMANSGALSIIVACLGSPCVLLRTCALACLQLVQNMLQQQNPTRDAAFRERAQLTLLLTYIRNAFDFADESITTAPHLPLTTAIFLGRAAMNVMQPNHDLFSRVNKYLLCRPFCDVKDVPLYDLLLVNGDAQSDQIQRLAALRLFRDGLATKQDHLNLCRKNAYNRMMLLFPLLAKDTRAGHAVLDLLDRGLGMRFSARYLLERCGLTAWIKLLAAPMGAMHLAAHTKDNTTRAKFIENEAGVLTHYSKYLVRAVTILRRIVASAYLLCTEDASTTVHLKAVHLVLTSVARDAANAVRFGYADSIPTEYFLQLVLCMWDVSNALSRVCTEGSSPAALWEDELVLELCDVIQLKFSTTYARQNSGTSSTELILSSLMLLKYCEVSNNRGMCNQRLCDAAYSYLIEHAVSGKVALSGAAAIVRPAQQHSAESASLGSSPVAPHTVLDQIADIQHYTNIVQHHEAVMALLCSGTVDPVEYADLAWSTGPNVDLNRMTALPTSLGRHCTLECVSEILASNLSPITSVDGAFDTLRAIMIMWTAYSDQQKLQLSASTESNSNDVFCILERKNVAQDVLGCNGRSTSSHLLQIAAHALHSVTSELCRLGTEVSDYCGSIQRAAAAPACSALAVSAFRLLAGMLTVHDSSTLHDNSVADSAIVTALQSHAEQLNKLCEAVGPVAVKIGADEALTADIRDFLCTVKERVYTGIPGLTLLNAADLAMPHRIVRAARVVESASVLDDQEGADMMEVEEGDEQEGEDDSQQMDDSDLEGGGDDEEDSTGSMYEGSDVEEEEGNYSEQEESSRV